MADSTCPSCGAPISGSVSSCPFCGGPIARSQPASSQPNRPVMSDEDDDAQFGNNPVQNQQMEPEPMMQQEEAYQPQPQRSRTKLYIVIAVIVIIAILMYSCSSDDDKDTKPAKPSTAATQVNTGKTAGQPVVVSTGLDGNQTAGNMNATQLYATMKQKMALAQRRYTQAWNKVPAEYRSAAQQSINTLPKQVDAKCKTLARQFMTPGQDTERRAIYLKCNMDHLNVLNSAIERYAQDVRNGNAGDFLNYANPQGLLNANWTYRK
ncbi:MAG: zinc ribbon domain-containing protein [Oxalobacter sp.]|nr:zinc ribbon domain-containing protein [Oxalobacter sp.]